jgi:hypothetical protein
MPKGGHSCVEAMIMYVLVRDNEAGILQLLFFAH